VLRDRDHTVSPAIPTGSAQRAPGCLTCFQRIASSCLQEVESNCELAIAGDSEAVHRMRIELTRLRAAALFFAPVTDDTAWPGIDRRLRWLNSVLGRVRNRDVAVEYAGRKHYRRCTAHWRRALLRSQERAHRRLARKLGSARYSHLASELHHWISGRPASPRGQPQKPDQLDVYCEERLRRWRDEIWEQGRHIRAFRRRPLHRLRILSKHYRYMVEALLDRDIPLSREDLLFCETARRVHQTLGELRDLRLLRKAIERRPPNHRKHERELIQRVEDLFRHRA
jgi:CHAD domain-containing protein